MRDVFPSPYTEADAEWWVSEGHRLGDVYNLAIETSRECIGTIGAKFFEDEYRYTAEIGYWLGKTYWRKGIMTGIVSEFTQLLFRDFPLKRIYAPVAHENKASIKLLEKCGFKCEGIFKSNLYLRGCLYDEHIYAYYPRSPE